MEAVKTKPTVIHIMRDGTVREDITGYVVRMKEAEAFYHLLDTVNGRTKKSHT